MQALAVVLVLAGLYLVLFHAAPWPLNHEQVGIGTAHNIHTIVGVVLIVAAAAAWWMGRRRGVAAP
jgi:hypothetical protein